MVPSIPVATIRIIRLPKRPCGKHNGGSQSSGIIRFPWGGGIGLNFAVATETMFSMVDFTKFYDYFIFSSILVILGRNGGATISISWSSIAWCWIGCSVHSHQWPFNGFCEKRSLQSQYMGGACTSMCSMYYVRGHVRFPDSCQDASPCQ
jgi:hypothetical protein